WAAFRTFPPHPMQPEARMPRRASWIAIVLLLISASYRVSFSSDLSKLDPLARRTVSQLRSGATPAALRASQAAALVRRLDAFVIGSFSRAALEAAGATVRTQLS